MKFIAQLMIGLLVSLSFAGLVSAQDETAEFNSDDGAFQVIQDAAQDRAEDEGVTFKQAQAAELAVIEATVKRLGVVQDNVEDHDNIHPDTKKIINDAIDEVIENLDVQAAAVKDAEDFDELEEAHDAWADLIQDSKEDIRSAVQEAMLQVSKNAQETFEELNAKFQELVGDLDDNCEEAYKDEAQAIQADYASFQMELGNLEDAIAKGDAATAKASSMELAELATTMVIELNQLWPYCEHPTLDSAV